LRAEASAGRSRSLAVAAFAAAAGYGVTLFAPDPHLYQVSQARGLPRWFYSICMPRRSFLSARPSAGRARGLRLAVGRCFALPMLWIAAG